jgi:hypothetical protein
VGVGYPYTDIQDAIDAATAGDTILVHPGVKRELDPRALDLFLTLEYIPAPSTIF